MARGQRRRRLGVEPVVVARDRHDGRAGELERLQRREVGRLLHEHGVARLEQHGRDQRQRLLGAARDQQLVGVRRQAARGQPGGDRGAQRRVALGRRVLQRAADDVVGQRGGERRARARRPSNSSGAGRPPANEITPGRSVSARMSRTGDDCTPRSRAASGGVGGVSTVIRRVVPAVPPPAPTRRRAQLAGRPEVEQASLIVPSALRSSVIARSAATPGPRSRASR